MSDLIRRLRNERSGWHLEDRLEAADKIDALAAENENWKREYLEQEALLLKTQYDLEQSKAQLVECGKQMETMDEVIRDLRAIP